MKAMVLAAGLGTRLRPLTADRPKALVEIDGRTLLEITLSRLREQGIREVILNVHHFAGMIVEFLQAKQNFGMRIEVSQEDVLLDTGGGLKKAAWFFKPHPGGGDEPFIVHNVDVLSSVNLRSMAQFHRERGALATLAVKKRAASRYLLFDDRLQLCGRRAAGNPKSELVPGAEPAEELGFSGIQVISSRLLAMMTEEGAFSLVTTYLRLAAAGETILAYRADGFYWRDLGRPENVQQAEEDLRHKVFH